MGEGRRGFPPPSLSLFLPLISLLPLSCREQSLHGAATSSPSSFISSLPRAHVASAVDLLCPGTFKQHRLTDLLKLAAPALQVPSVGDPSTAPPGHGCCHRASASSSPTPSKPVPGQIRTPRTSPPLRPARRSSAPSHRRPARLLCFALARGGRPRASPHIERDERSSWASSRQQAQLPRALPNPPPSRPMGPLVRTRPASPVHCWPSPANSARFIFFPIGEFVLFPGISDLQKSP